MPLGCAEIGNVFLSIFARMAPWEWARTTDLTVNSRPLYQLRNRLSDLMTSVNSSGMPSGLVTSRQAPSSEMFRTTQSIPAARSKDIVPDFKMRDRGVVRFSITIATTINNCVSICAAIGK